MSNSARPLRARDEEGLKDVGRPVRLERRFGIAHRGALVDDVGDEFALQGQAVDLGADQTLSQLIQDQRTADQDGQAQQIENDDQPAEARTKRPDPDGDGRLPARRRRAEPWRRWSGQDSRWQRYPKP